MIHGLLVALGHHLWPVLLALQLTLAAVSILIAQASANPAYLAAGAQYVAAGASMITAIAVLITARNNGRKIDVAQMLSADNSGKLDVVKARVEGVKQTVVGVGDRVAAVAHRVDSVHDVAVHADEQVTTMNKKSLANLGDDEETRRIEDLAPEDRTQDDVDHLESAAEHGPQVKKES